LAHVAQRCGLALDAVAGDAAVESGGERGEKVGAGEGGREGGGRAAGRGKVLDADEGGRIRGGEALVGRLDELCDGCCPIKAGGGALAPVVVRNVVENHRCGGSNAVVVARCGCRSL